MHPTLMLLAAELDLASLRTWRADAYERLYLINDAAEENYLLEGLYDTDEELLCLEDDVNTALEAINWRLDR